MNSTDRRVARTRASLKQALVKLSVDQGYDEVTIQEITEEANVGYRTFFRHYQDKETLLNEVLQVIFDEILELMMPNNSIENSEEKFIFISPERNTLLFQHAEENCDLYRLLLNSGSEMMEFVMKFACNAAKENRERLSDSKIPSELVAHYIVSSLISMIRWWLDNNMPYPPQEMGKYASQLIKDPVIETISKT